MVIVNFENEACIPSSSDKRMKRRNRRNPGIPASALDQALRNAHSTTEELAIKDLPDFQYSHIYKRTRKFLSASLERVKAVGRYLSGPVDYCAHCQEYRRFFEEGAVGDLKKSSETIYLRDCKHSDLSASKRFSDSFVEKVRSQQQQPQPQIHESQLLEKTCSMPCCAVCNRPRPALDYYCTCDEPTRRMTVSGGYRHGRAPPTRYWAVPKKKKKHKRWWCCGKKPSDSWDQCCYCHQRLKRASQLHPPAPPPFGAYAPCVPPPWVCQCPPNVSMLKKLRQCMNGSSARYDLDVDAYHPCMEPVAMPLPPEQHQRQHASCNWCAKGYNIARTDPSFEDPRAFNRPRSCSCSRRPSVEETQRGYRSDDEYVEEFNSDSDDCCCCCPCRKNFNTTNVQTEDCRCDAHPKHTDTQTERCCGKRRCCRCCRNACGVCTRERGKDKCGCTRHACMRAPPRSGNASPSRAPSDASRAKHKAKTIICKAAGVQHDPSGCSTVFPSLPSDIRECDSTNCHKMQSVLFGNLHPTPLFLDKMFAPINPLATKLAGQGYSLSASPLSMKMNSQFLSSAYSNAAPDVDRVAASEVSISARTKKRLMNAMCDSILCDLSSKRRNSYSDLRKSPDSGYQEPKLKKSFFGLRKLNSSNKTDAACACPAKCCMEHIVKTLKCHKSIEKPASTSEKVMGEASKIVRGILEEISAQKNVRQEETAGVADDGSSELKQVRGLLLSMGNMDAGPSTRLDLEQTRSDSVLLDCASLSGASTEDAGGVEAAAAAPHARSYTKLLMAFDAMRNKTRKLSKS